MIGMGDQGWSLCAVPGPLGPRPMSLALRSSHLTPQVHPGEVGGCPVQPDTSRQSSWYPLKETLFCEPKRFLCFVSVFVVFTKG